MTNRPRLPLKKVFIQQELPVEDLTPFERALLQRLEAIEDTQGSLMTGQTDLTVAFGKVSKELAALAPRVEKVEKDAAMKAQLLKWGKLAAGPVLGFAAHYLPGLASHIPAILEAIGKVAADGVTP